jgi:preprotein translocase subunit SecD
MPNALQNPFGLWLILTALLVALVYAFVRRELRPRAAMFGAFILACVVMFWPPYDTPDGKPGKIKLGLDLRGGVHLVMQVMTDQAIAAVTDDSVQTAREQLSSKGVPYTNAQRADLRTFTVEGVNVSRLKEAREILQDNFRSLAGWDVHDGGDGKFTVKITDSQLKQLRDQTVKETIRTLERRVNQLGVAEPVIAQQGTAGDQILIQLPGVTDVDQAKRVIERTAQLALKIVEADGSSKEELLARYQGNVPPNLELLQGPSKEAGKPDFYLVRREAAVTGRDLKNAYVGQDENGAPAIHFSLTPTGSTKFGNVTGANVNKKLAIILDGTVESAPNIQTKITAEGVITGRYSREEADELSKILRAGALPASLRYLQQLTVGASLGRDSIRSGVTAAAAGMLFLTGFMLVYYRLSGLNAIIALTANLIILLGFMAYMGATLTLPGIAGVILTIGVGVDTNVLVFERIREELRNGKPVRNAVNNGFERVWITILDTHATALIAAIILYQFGTGPVRGFAVTLVTGLVANVFASYFVSKFIFDWVLGKRQVGSLSI